MKQRCYNPKNPSYKFYGALGVTVCDEWKNNFVLFCKWAFASGYNSCLELDRINPAGNYEPENCRWVTKMVNARNKRKIKKINIFGESKIFSEWALDSRCRTTFSSFWHRVRRGWSAEKAISSPLTFVRKIK